MVQFENPFLRKLSDAQLGMLCLEPCRLKRHTYVYRMDDQVTQLYFMERAFVSLMSPLPDGEKTTVWSYDGTIIGSQIRFWIPETVYDIYVRVGGDGWCVPRALFLDAMLRDPDFNHRVLNWIHFFDHGIANAAACQVVHNVEQRLCRMLLKLQDAMKGDRRIPLSVPEIAAMLMAAQSHVYRLARGLEDLGAISISGNHIELIDTPILTAGACVCFEATSQRRARALQNN